MASSFKNLDAELKSYLRDHRLPDVYESLLTGLTVMCPDDAKQFIIDKLHELKEYGSSTLHWDCFVDVSMKPPKKIFSESSLDSIFNFDEDSTPSPAMYIMAYNHFNDALKRKCYRAWIRYHLMIQHKKNLMAEKMTRASTHHDHRMMRMNLNIWLDWLRFRKGRQAMALNKLQSIFDRTFCRVIFKAWHMVTLDAKKTREYFEVRLSRLERGENVEEDEGFTVGDGEARDDISMMPIKVAAQIFSNLGIPDLATCALVCRSWKVITQSSSLFNQLDFSVFKKIHDKGACKLLMKCRPYLVHLNMRECSQFGKSTYQAISECKNLQDLNLYNCSTVLDDVIKPVLESCRVLLYMNLSHCSITDASLRTMATNCTNLQFLSIAGCTQFTDKGLFYLSQGMGAKKLTYLDISECEQISLGGYKYLSVCQNLRNLIMNNLTNLTDEFMLPIAKNCQSLRSLSVLDSPLLTDATFKMIASYGKLEKFRIEGNQCITDATIKSLTKFCPELRHVYVVDCLRIGDSSMKSLSTCHNLSVLNMADCIKIGDSGVRHIVDGTCGPNLRELNLTNCIRIGDMGMVNIHKRCQNLTYLSLCYCEHLSEAGIELLGQAHRLLSLDISGCNCGDQALSSLGNNSKFRDVSLSRCSDITDLGLQKFAQSCKDLERLDLSHCQQLTDGAIKNLAFCCRMLNVLNLAGCKALTDMSMQYLSGVCHHLHTLDLSGCILLSDKSIKYLRKGCQRLRNLIILYCRGINKTTANKISRFVETVEHSSEDVPSDYDY